MKRTVKIIIWLITVLPLYVNAAIISADWLAEGDNLITRDSNSGLEWLDLTVTSNLSRNYVNSQRVIGGDYYGWRYATSDEVAGFFDAFGGVGPYNGWSTNNNGLFDLIAPYWGDLYCASAGCPSYVPGQGSGPGLGSSNFYIADYGFGGQYYAGIISDQYNNTAMTTYDWIRIKAAWYDSDSQAFDFGSALVRDTNPVPLPATFWLFFSGLFGLLGLSRQRTKRHLNQ